MTDQMITHIAQISLCITGACAVGLWITNKLPQNSVTRFANRSLIIGTGAPIAVLWITIALS